VGAFKVEVMLHDREVIRFVRTALRDDAHDLMGPDATYVGRRIADQNPEILAAIERGEEAE
jgi:hypothetical protein